MGCVSEEDTARAGIRQASFIENQLIVGGYYLCAIVERNNRGIQDARHLLARSRLDLRIRPSASIVHIAANLST
jgi:hypothetical protein